MYLVWIWFSNAVINRWASRAWGWGLWIGQAWCNTHGQEWRQRQSLLLWTTLHHCHVWAEFNLQMSNSAPLSPLSLHHAHTVKKTHMLWMHTGLAHTNGAWWFIVCSLQWEPHQAEITVLLRIVWKRRDWRAGEMHSNAFAPSVFLSFKPQH